MRISDKVSRRAVVRAVPVVAAVAGVGGAFALFGEQKRRPPVPPAKSVAPARRIAAMGSLEDVRQGTGFSMAEDGESPLGRRRILTLSPPPGREVEAIIPLDGPVDMRSGSLRFVVRHMADLNSIDRGSVELHSSPVGSPARDYSLLIGENEFIPLNRHFTTSDGAGPGRWQTIGASTRAVVPVGAGADLSAVRWLKLRTRSAPGKSPFVIHFGPILFQPDVLDRAKLLIGFDDAYESTFTTAFPMMRERRIPGILFPGAVQEVVGQPGRMTVEQMTQLQTAGWQVGSQAWSSEQDQSQRDVDALNGWMREHGFTGGGFGSYYSSIGERRLDKWPIFDDNYRAIRTFNTPLGANPPMIAAETYPWMDRGIVHALAGDGRQADPRYRQAFIDQAIASRGVAIMVWHNDVTGLKETLDYAAGMSGMIDVTTEEKLVADYGEARRLSL